MNDPPQIEFKTHPRFTIIRQIGAGGMGAVYEAIDAERNMHVALKTLPTVEPARLYQFKQEFRALAEISHPNLASLYELIGEGDRWFFTMELIDDPEEFFPITATKRASESTHPDSAIPANARAEEAVVANSSRLQTSDLETGFVTVRDIQSTPRSESILPSSDEMRAGLSQTDESLAARSNYHVDYDHVRNVFAQLAHGVSALHRLGKLHCDLKPGNVIVRKSGRVVILDFGLVSNLEPVLHERGTGTPSPASMVASTREGSICGTLAYMSPEQAAGEPLTPASDWYAVGVMLFQVLTGRLPFLGGRGEILYQKLERRAPAPSSVCPLVPQDLDRLCIALLNRDQLARPSGHEVLEQFSKKGDTGYPKAADWEQISELLPFVGREADIARLTGFWIKVRAGNALTVFVQGRSGTGKTAMIGRFLDEISADPVTLILAGRCYEQESVPYKALDSVVDSLTRYLLPRPANEIVELIPPGIGALARLFPVLKGIPAIAEYPSGEAAESGNLQELRRFAFAALRELIGRLSRRRAVVIYIDDLQWGDADSGFLLTELIRSPNAPTLLLLLACRTEYAEQSACLRAFAEAGIEPGTAGARETLTLGALSESETTRLAVALLGGNIPENRLKAEWVTQESGGTPFFVYELVQHLKSGISQTVAENTDMDEVLWLRVNQLPADALQLLEVVSIAARPLPLRTIQHAAGFSTLPPQIVTLLRSNHLIRTTGPTLEDEIETFHDRVRESVTTHLPAKTRAAHHRALAENLESAAADPEILAVHFEGAGIAAKAGSYYSAAAEQAVRSLAFDRAEELFRKAAALTHSSLELARIHERMIHFFTDMARFDQAYAIAREALGPLGLSLEANFIPPRFVFEFIHSKLRLGRRRPLDLLTMPTVSNETAEMAIRLINATAKAAYQIRPELCVAISTRAVNLCLSQGNTPDCAICYVVYGTIFQGAILGNRQTGYDFGRLALSLIDKYHNERQRAEVNFVVGYFGISWLKPALEAEQLWQVAWDSGLKTGDLFHTGCAAAGTTMSQFMRGVPFEDLLHKMDSFLEVLKRFNLREAVGVIAGVRQAIRNLRGETNSLGSITDAAFDGEEFRHQIDAYGSRHFAHFYFIIRMQLLYLWGDYQRAAEFARTSATYLNASKGMLHSTEHYFYLALNAAARASTAGWLNRYGLVHQLCVVHSRFRQWARTCPENFLARERLLAGEIARLRGRQKEAIAAFRVAADAAREHSAPHLSGLSERLLSDLYRTSGDAVEADRSRTRAIESYRRWGATRYADHLVARP
jgi:serine/threonine protein kinase/predicted ATPase